MVDTKTSGDGGHVKASAQRAEVARMVKKLPPLWSADVAAWATSLRAAGRPESTVRTRVEHVRWLAVAHADRAPAALTLDDLMGWLGTRTWARETRRGVRASLRSFYGWAVKTGRMATSPAMDLPSVAPSRPNPRPTPESAYRLALATADERTRLMVRLAAEMGLRRAEVAGIHSRDVVEDLTGWSLNVHGKGQRERLVPLTPVLARELRALPAGYAFPGDEDGHLSPRWVGTLVGRTLPEGWTMHSLRHRAATRWYGVDRDLLTVGELLGHASPVTTRVYVRLPDDARRRLVNAVT